MRDHTRNQKRMYRIHKQEEKILEQELMIAHLQQKVEQLEKENIKQKEIIENLTTMTVCGDKKQIKNTAQYKLEQLENIINEAKEECKSVIGNPEHTIVSKNELMKLMLNTLNKGDKNE